MSVWLCVCLAVVILLIVPIFTIPNPVVFSEYKTVCVYHEIPRRISLTEFVCVYHEIPRRISLTEFLQPLRCKRLSAVVDTCIEKEGFCIDQGLLCGSSYTSRRFELARVKPN